MSQISLTAPMRSNLLSLQNIAGQQDIVQNRLATGLKVSSAIDNPSAYYTAASLSNRAADLTALLDAMSQGIQTIKSASEAIDAGIKFLEQAKAVADQALETAIPAKEWFIEQVGENGAVVETAQELLDAVNTGKETIVVYGKIEFALNERIVLKNGQKLVGTEYYTGLSARNADGSRFSQLSFSSDQDNIKAIQARDDCRVSDLDISHRQLSQSFTESVLQAYGKDIVFADLNIDFQGGQTERHGQSAVSVSGQNGNSVTLSGKINIRASGGSARGIGVFNGGSLLIDKDAEVNVQMGSFSVGGIGMWIWMQGSAVIEGKLQISNATTGIGLAAYTATANYAGNYLSVASGAELYFNNCENLLSSSRTIDSRYANSLSFENGAKIAFDGNYFTCGGYQNINADDIIFNMDAEFILNNAQFSPTGDFYFPEEMITETSADQQKLYNSVLQQYNMLIATVFIKALTCLTDKS